MITFWTIALGLTILLYVTLDGFDLGVGMLFPFAPDEAAKRQMLGAISPVWLTHMAIGDRAEIRVDTFPGEVLHGHVLAFAPGSGAEFALLPPDNATGNFTKVVQRIAVKITIDDGGELAGRLRPGMSVVADVDAVNGERP